MEQGSETNTEQSTGTGTSYDALIADYTERGDIASLFQKLEDAVRDAADAEAALAVIEAAASAPSASLEKKRVRRLFQVATSRFDDAIVLFRRQLAFARELGDSAETLRALEALSAAEQDDAVKAQLLEEMGDMAKDTLSRPQDALMHYQAAFRVRRTQVSAIRKGAEVYFADGRWEPGFALLKRELEVYEREDDLSVPPDLVDGFVRVAEGLINLPHAHGVAREALEGAERLAPNHQRATELLKTLDEYPQRWKEHVRQLRDQALDARDKREAAHKYLAIAQIYRAYAPDDPSQMQQNLDKCFLLAPGYWPALRFCEDVYRSGGRIGEFIAWLKDHAKGIRNVEIATQIWTTVGVLLAEQGASVEDRAQAYEEIRRIDPRNQGAMTALTELFLEARQFEDAARVMEDFLHETADQQAKRRTLRTLARIYEVELEQPKKAAEQLEALLAAGGPDDVLAHLADLYSRVGDEKNLAAAYERMLRARQVVGDEERTLLERLFELYQGTLAEPEKAFAAARRLYVLAPTDALEAELVRLADALARPGELAGAYLSASDAVAEPEQRRGLRIKAARAYVTSGDGKKGRDVLTQLLTENPQDKEATELFDRILEREADPEELVQVLEERLKTLDDTHDRVKTLLTLAEGYDRLRRPRWAIERLAAVLQVQAQHEGALEKLDALYRAEEEFVPLADILERRIEVCVTRGDQPELVVDLMRRLARLYDERLGEADRAAELYLSLYDAVPEDPDILRALERLLDRQVRPVAIAEVLQPYYAKVQAWRRHVDMMAIRRDAEENVERRAALSRAMAGMFQDRLSSPRDAFDALARALIDEPSAGDEIRELEQLAEESGAHASYAEVLLQVSERLPEGPGKNALLARRATLLQGVLGDQQAAIDTHRLVLEKTPDHVPTLDALADLYGQREEYDALVDILTRRLAHTDAEMEATVAARLGTVVARHLGKPDDAEEALRRAVFAEVPLPLAARRDPLEMLVQIYRARHPDAAAELAEVLHRYGECLAGAERVDVRIEEGDVLARQLGEHQRALDAYEAALANDATAAGAVDGLRFLVDESGVDDDVRRTAARVLLERYRLLDDVPGQTHVLAIQEDMEGDIARQRKLFHERVSLIAGELEDPEQALVILLARLETDPDDEQTRDRSETLAAALGQMIQVTSMYTKLRELDDDELKRTYADRLARLLERTGDTEAAVEALAYLLDLEPEQTDAWERLRAVYDRANDGHGVARCLEALANLTEGPAQVARFQVLADYAFEVLEDPDRGIDALVKCRAVVPDDDSILARLHEKLREHGRDEELVDVLFARAQIAHSQGDAAGFLLEAGRVLFERLGRKGDAVAALKQSLTVERDGNATAEVTQLLQSLAELEDDAAIEALDAIIEHHRSGQAWHPLVEALEIAAEKRPPGEERARLYDEVSRLQEEQLRAPQLAFVAACGALREEAEPERIDRVRALAEATGAYADLMAVLEDVAKQVTEQDPERAVRMYREVLALSSRLDEVDAQARAAEAVLSIKKGDPEALALLEAIHRSRADQGQLIEVLQRRADGTEDPVEKKGALLELGRLLEENGDDVDADNAYRGILALDENDAEGLAALDALYGRTGNSAAHVQVLAQRIDLAEAPDEKADHLVRLAVLKLTRRGDPAGATDALSAALQVAPAHAGLRQGLESLVAHARSHGAPPLADAAALLEQSVRAQEDFAAVPQVIEMRLSVAQEKGDRAALLLEMAAVQEQKLDAAPMAFNTLCRALGEAPSDERLRAEAERLAIATQSEEVLASVYEAVLDQIEDPALAAHLNQRMAHIAEQVGGDTDEARERLYAAVQSGADDLETLSNLVRLSREPGGETILLDALGRLATRAEADEQTALAVETLAELSSARENVGDVEGAITAAEQVVRLSPADLSARAEYSRLLARGERFDQLESHLVEVTGVAEAPEAKAEALAQLIYVRLENLNDFEGAVFSLEQLAEVFPAADTIVQYGAHAISRLQNEKGDEVVELRARIARLLRPRYEARQAWRELAFVLGLELQATTAGDDRKALWLELIRIYDEKLDAPEQTFMQAGRALTENPADGDLRDRVERISVKLGDLETLVGLYEDILETLTDNPDLAGVYALRTGELYEGGVGDPGQAARFYEHALTLVDEQSESRAELLDRLERLYRTMTDAPKLAMTLKRRAALLSPEEDAEVARKMLLEAANIERTLGDQGGAIGTLRKLLEFAPTDLAAVEMLTQACAAQGRHAELAEALELKLSLIAGRDKSVEWETRFALGRVLREELNRSDEAEAQFKAVLDENPEHGATRAYLHDSMGGGMTGESARFLEDAYAATGDWNKVVEVLENQLRDAESRGDRTESKDLFLRIAEIQETNLSSPELAFLKLTLALKQDPTDTRVRERLERIARGNEDLEDLCEIYEDEANEAMEAGRGSVAADLREAAARLWANDLGEGDRAIAMYESILEEQPGRPSSQEALTDLYARQERWEDHEQILRRRLMFLDEAKQRAALLLPLAQTVADHLDRPEDAIALVEEARRLVPHHVEARRLLIELKAVDGEPQEVRALLEEEVQFCRDAEDADNLTNFRRRLAVLLAGELDDPEGAVPLWEEIRAEDPADNSSFNALKRLYERTEKWNDLRALYEEELENERDPGRNSRLQQELSTVLAEHLGGAEEAIGRHLDVLKFEPRNRTSLDALRRLYRNTGQFEELVAMLRKMMRNVTDPQDLKELRFDLADALGAHLGKRVEAVETGRYILDIEPHTDEQLARLEVIFRTNDAHQELVGVMERHVALLEDEPRVSKLRELAKVYEDDLKQPGGAAPAYAQILEAKPADDEAYGKLASIYEKAGEYQQLIALKEARLAEVETSTDKVSLLRDIGRINEELVGNAMFAFMAASRAYQVNYDDDDIATWMEGLGIATEMVDTVIESYEDALGFVSDESRIINLHLRIADLAHKHADDDESAESHLKRALEYDAANADAIEALVALFVERGRWDDAVFYLERKADTEEELETRIAVLCRAARLLDEHAGDVDRAVDTYKRVLELAPEHGPTLTEYAALLERAERWDTLIPVLERQEDLADDVAEKVDLRGRIAIIWEQELSNPEQAIESYRMILEQTPDSTVALKALERLHTSQAQASDLVKVFEDMLRSTDQPDERIRLLSKISSTWEDSLDDPNQAIEANERILVEDEGNLGALKNLSRLLRATDQWDRLVDVLKKQVQISGDPDEITKLYIEIGDVHYKEIGDSAKAEEYFNAALDHDPTSGEALHELGQLYERSGNWFNALENLKKEAEIRGATPEGVDLMYRIGKINEEMLLDTESAKESYGQALDVDPGHIPSIQALKEIAHTKQDWDAYLNWLRTEARYTDDDYARTDLHTQAGLFLQDERSDLDEAAEEFEKALRYTGDHLEAAMPLAEICFRNEQWERAEELLDIVVAGLDEGDDTDALVRHHYRLGYVCEKLDKDAKALQHYQAGYDVDATNLPILEGLGASLARAERYDDAAKIYQAILIHHRDMLTDAEVVDYFEQLASMYFKLDHLERSQRNLEKALELDRGHAPSLRLLADIYVKQQDYEEAYETLFQLSRHLTGDEKAATLVEVGALSRDQLDDAYRAIDAYAEAARVRAQDPVVLEALFSLYKDTAQGQQAVEVLEELVRIEPDEKARVRLNLLLGETYRDELKADGRAVQYFNAALDLDPTFIKAFEAIETLLSQRQNWPALEQNYIAMIRRIPEDQSGIKSVLWRNLGDLYRYKLNNAAGAVQAYRVLQRAQPDNIEILENLAVMLAQAGQVDEAIGAYQELMPKARGRQKAILHQLLRLYLNRGLTDRAYVACAALALHGDLQGEEQKLYGHYKRRLPPRAARTLTDELWHKALVHPHARGPVADIARQVWRAAGGLLTQDRKAFGLDKKRQWTQLDLDAPVPHYFVTQFKYVRDVLATGPVELHVRRGAADPVNILPLNIPTVAVGEGNEVFREMPQRVLWFIIGRQLAYLRPEFILARTLGAADFTVALEAAITAIEPRYPVTSDPRVIQNVQQTLARIGPAFLGAVRVPVQNLLATGQVANVIDYLKGIEHTAVRAATLVAGDLEVAAQVLRQPDIGPMPLPYGEKLGDLLDFSVSEAHFELRQNLGLVVVAQ